MVGSRTLSLGYLGSGHSKTGEPLPKCVLHIPTAFRSFLLFNPCSFVRSIVMELFRTALPLAFGNLMAYAEWEMLTVLAAVLGPAEGEYILGCLHFFSRTVGASSLLGVFVYDFCNIQGCSWREDAHQFESLSVFVNH